MLQRGCGCEQVGWKKGQRNPGNLQNPTFKGVTEEVSWKKTTEEIQEAKGKKGWMPQEKGKREIEQKGAATLSSATDLKEPSEIGLKGTVGNLNLTRFSRMWGSGKRSNGSSVFDLMMTYHCLNQDLTRKTVTTLGTSRKGSLMQRIGYPSDVVQGS